MDHKLLLAEEEVNVMFDPVQKVVAPLAEIVGTAGAPGSIIDVETVLELQPLS